MRRCHQCGSEFSLFQHVLRRGEFCSQKCFEAYERQKSRRQDLQERRRIDDQAKLPTYDDRSEKKAQPPTVVQFQEGEGGHRLYFISAEYQEFRISQLMGSRHAIFGIRVPWPLAWRKAATDNNVSALPTMEQLAAPYAAALRAHTGHLPCVLAGYSFAGLIAFESARQLRAQGVKVEMVILLDTRAKYPFAPRQIAWKKLQKDWKQPLDGGSRERILSFGTRVIGSWFVIQWMLATELRAMVRSLSNSVLRDPGQLTESTDEQGVRLRWSLLERLYMNVGRAYTARQLNCRGVLFLGDLHDERPARELDGSLGWRGLFSGGFEIIEVPGDHIAIMRQEPYNSMLAEKLNDLLNRLSAGPTDKRGPHARDAFGPRGR